MEPRQVVIGRAAEIALNSLRPSEREQVLRDIDRLKEKTFPPDAANVYRVEGPPELLVLRTLDRLRVVYTVEVDDTISVRDVVNQDIVDRYFRHPAPTV